MVFPAHPVREGRKALHENTKNFFLVRSLITHPLCSLSLLPTPHDVMDGIHSWIKDLVVDDLKRPRKQDHWIWYIFPTSKIGDADAVRVCVKDAEEALRILETHSDLAWWSGVLRNIARRPAYVHQPLDVQRVGHFCAEWLRHAKTWPASRVTPPIQSFLSAVVALSRTYGPKSDALLNPGKVRASSPSSRSPSASGRRRSGARRVRGSGATRRHPARRPGRRSPSLR